jgi:archaellum component FlaC
MKHRYPRNGRPYYDPEVIKHVLREVMYQKEYARIKAQSHVGGSRIQIYGPVAEKLNKDGVLPFRGGTSWTSTSVASLYQSYKKKYHISLSPKKLMSIRQLFTAPFVTTNVASTAVAAETKVQDLLDSETTEKLKNAVTSTPKPPSIQLKSERNSEFKDDISSAKMFDRLARHRSAIKAITTGGLMSLQENLKLVDTTFEALREEMNNFTSTVEHAIDQQSKQIATDPLLLEKASRFDAVRDLLGYKFDE